MNHTPISTKRLDMPSGYWSQDMFFRLILTSTEMKQLAFQIQLMIKRAETVALGEAGSKPDAGVSSSRIRQVKAVRESARPPARTGCFSVQPNGQVTSAHQ
jgi:hypothetical protein